MVANNDDFVRGEMKATLDSIKVTVLEIKANQGEQFKRIADSEQRLSRTETYIKIIWGMISATLVGIGGLLLKVLF